MEYTILENKGIAPSVYQMKLRGNTEKFSAPGQFLQFALPGFFLRRPISICDYDADTVTLIYKVVGQGTEKMAELPPETKVDCLPGLGNGFDISLGWQHPLIVGGGVGLPPLYGLAKALKKKGITPTVVMGFNRKEEIFLKEEFEALGVPAVVATMDGSCGIRGLVTDAMKQLPPWDGYYACGPLPMLKAVAMNSPCPGQLSFEERMACGFGACMGCSCQTKNGYKRICKDGPVLSSEEVLWK